ncbi:hypothetical protein DCAR_0624772 [Daucus carota subsp. sativus]|uniref:Uncharacterized protein n=1 Tax=Daucus carota subsp. sativus TaxID=79200 RepID=A0A164W1C9_DAUCS|nr:PREDICTED: leucine-rich repeat receptor-like serine/threonine-protein kinase At1g17230 [Daucus carota subsp. sativus]WOH05356.1 hypothetical protein DCAR_0624772 [Daucus carota subsp. sativus]
MATTLSSLTLLSIIFTLLLRQAHSVTHWEDIRVLEDFKNAVTPNSVSPGSCLSSWDFTLDPCDNLYSDKFTCGFRCDLVVSNASRVTELALDQAGYSGTLSSNLNLPYLQTLDLSNNFFTGPIPNSLSNLTRLQKLSLSGNSFTSSVPDSIGSLISLEDLSLDYNDLRGTVPFALNGLKNLKRLQLGSNQLTGEFPELTQLSQLVFLDASNNAISGNIPSRFPPSVMEIIMRNNQIQGKIPENILSNLSYLQVLDLSHNQLTESIPPSLFTHPTLQQLTLSYNNLQAIQSPATSNYQNTLIEIDLSNNNIHGFLPGFMGRMPSLSALSLENNKFTGMIPTQYAVKAVFPETGTVPFQRLLLGGNYLLGGIPGPLTGLKPGSVNVNLGDNCLYRCPAMFFFCQGGSQKSFTECKNFGPVIP